MATSIAKPGERGTPVVGDVIRLAALDLVLWIVRARMVGVAFDLEMARVHADDRAADTAGLGIPTHAIMDLEAVRHVVRSDAAEQLQKEAVLALNISAA